MEEILRFEHVSYAYEEEREALLDVCVKVCAGERVAVLGSNGAGKSTFFLLANGVLRPGAGRILFRGAPVGGGAKQLNVLRRGVGLVFQDPEVQLLGGSVRFHGDYPAWTYARESALRDRCVAVYEAQYGAKPQIVAIHAGLECGILSGKIDGLDCISFGPNLLHVHTPNERADIASVARVWEYLKAILAYKA